ncbi:MAG: hypothetical protein V3U60_15245, partial [Gammaproteobacteria bacterium]
MSALGRKRTLDEQEIRQIDRHQSAKICHSGHAEKNLVCREGSATGQPPVAAVTQNRAARSAVSKAGTGAKKGISRYLRSQANRGVQEVMAMAKTGLLLLIAGLTAGFAAATWLQGTAERDEVVEPLGA